MVISTLDDSINFTKPRLTSSPEPRKTSPSSVAIPTRSTRRLAYRAIKRLSWKRSFPFSAIPNPYVEFVSTTNLSANTWCFKPNNFELPATTIAALYKSRWQIELFFKWIKQHLRIKTVLQHQPKRREGTDLDRDLRLSARGHPQEATRPRAVALHNPTDPQCLDFRGKQHWQSCSRNLITTIHNPLALTSCYYSTNVGTLLKRDNENQPDIYAFDTTAVGLSKRHGTGSEYQTPQTSYSSSPTTMRIKRSVPTVRGSTRRPTSIA